MIRGKDVAQFLFAAVVFALAYTQSPLYYSNQNQYFLHGLAQAGRGQLADDWLANTADPTPVFTALVAVTARFLDDYVFHLYYVLFFGVYVISLLGTWCRIAPIGSRLNESDEMPSPVQRLAFLAGLVLIHSALLRWLSCQLFGADYLWYFQAGLAGQYLLGSMFQPSVFGVLLLLSIYLFLADRPYAAAVAASLSAVLHFTYLLGAAILVLSYAFILAREGRGRDGFRSGLLALVLVLPVFVYVATAFGPTSAETAAQARAILVHFRVPHHALIEHWLDGIAVLQVFWIVAGMLLVRRTRLFAVMLISLLAGLVLTLVQWLTASDTLALLFPWRVSTYLVPLATAIMLGKFVMHFVPPFSRDPIGERSPIGSRLNGQIVIGVSSLVLAVCAIGGIVIMERQLGYLRNDEELAVYDYVKANLEPGQTYLVPYKLPNPTGTRGSRSNDFLMEDDQTGKRIPLDMQRFRLHATAPILADFKAIPYKDVELLEWHGRLRVGKHIYRNLEAGHYAEARRHIDDYRLTHIVSTRVRPLRAEQLEAIYQDEHYLIYRIRPRKP